MRKIKFRGISIEDRTQWYYGYLNKWANGETTIYDIDTDFCWRVDPETVGEFIGELDKNRNEIYEGDTIINPYQIAEDDPAHGVYEEKYIVKFISGMFTLQEENDGDFVDSLPDWKNLMVIENPELLKEK